MNKITTAFIVRIIICVLSFYCATLIFWDENRPTYYESLAFIPLSFGLLTLFCPKVYDQIPKNIGVTFLVLLLFYRDVVLFIVMFFGQYGSVLKLNIHQTIGTAVFLVIYEMFGIFMTIVYVLNRDEKRPYVRKKWNVQYIGLFNLILIFFVIIDVYAWMAIPGLRDEYRSIFDMNSDTFTHVIYHSAEHGSFEKILATLFSVTFGITRLLVPVILIHKFSIWFKHHSVIGLMLSGLLIFLQLFFISSTIAFGLICCLLLLIYTSMEFPQERKLIYYSTLVGSVCFIFFYFYSRYEVSPGGGMYHASTYSQALSLTQNAYFSGIDNVAASLNNGYEEYTLMTMIKDVVTTIPFNTTIFGNIDEQNSFVLFNMNNGTHGQIPTTVGMGYSYFGPIIAPVFSIILTYICVTCGCKLQRERNTHFSIVYLAAVLYAAMGIVMYNFSISGQYIVGIAFILYWMLTIKGDSTTKYADS